MTIAKFRQIHRGNEITLPLPRIKLAEHYHTQAATRGCEITELHREPVCIVRCINKTKGAPQYALVTGYRDYMTAKANGADEVKAIIVDVKSRRDFLKKLNTRIELWNTTDVHEPNGWTSPRPEKILNCRKNYEVTGTFGKAIVVSPNGTILDGYAAVCAAREMEIPKIPVYVATPNFWHKVQKKNKKMKKFSKTP